MNKKEKVIMWTSVLSPVLIVLGVVLLVLGSIPKECKIENDTLTVKFILGKKVIDLEGAQFMPVPDDVSHNIVRTNGTSVGKIHSGHYKNIKTKNKYIFYLNGKGERVYFEVGGQKYLIDNVTGLPGTDQ